MLRFFALLAVIVFSVQYVSAQDDTVLAAPKQKRPWFLTLAMDIKAKSVQGQYKYFYAGEYSKSGLGNDWAWREKTTRENKLLQAPSQFYDVKMDVLLSRNRSTKLGLSYNFGILDYRKYDTIIDPFSGDRYLSESSTNLSFIAITALFEYTHYFKKGQIQNNPFAYGSVAGGFYRASEYNGGPGNEYFTEGRLGLGYHFKHDWLVRVWAAQNFLIYREHLQSLIFNREQTRNIDMNLTYFGVGFAKQFELIPD